MDSQLIDQYPVVISWSDDDNAYIAEMPDLPGCLADGATESEARENIRVIAQEWINRARYLGRTLPAPQSLASV